MPRPSRHADRLRYASAGAEPTIATTRKALGLGGLLATPRARDRPGLWARGSTRSPSGTVLCPQNNSGNPETETTRRRMVPPLTRRPPRGQCPRSGMTRPALSTAPNKDRVADVRRSADCAPRPDRGFHRPKGLRRACAGRLFAVPADHRGGPIEPRDARLWCLPPRRGWAKGMGGESAHAGAEAGAGRVVIIGCEQRLFVHTRPENWAMTDRQIGWLNPSLGQKTENMIPCIGSAERPSRPRDGAVRECGEGPHPWARPGVGGVGRGRRWRHPLAVVQTTLAYLETGLRPRIGRSINNASGGHWRSTEGRAWAPVARGVHYNWKGPPT